MEESSRESLSDRISGLLAALKKSQSSQSVSNPSAAAPVTDAAVPEKNTLSNVQAKSLSFLVETLPDLLEFLKGTSNPKLLREVVARFLENPLLSDNDRDLVKKKVREKIEEEKKKREAKKAAAFRDSPAQSDISSRAQERVEDSPNMTTRAPSDTGTEQRTGQITIRLNNSNPLINALLDKKVETQVEPPAESDNGTQHCDWVTSSDALGDSSAILGAAEVPVPSQVFLNGVPIQNPILLPDNAFSAPPPTINPYMVLPQQISQMAGVFSVPPPVTFQVPPPNALVTNHGAAGFVNYGNNAVNSSAIHHFKTAVDYEKDMIPRTPTPPPTPPPIINPRIRAGAMVPVLTASGRLIMPGARLLKRPQGPTEASMTEKEGAEEIKKEKRRKKDRNGVERDADTAKISLLDTLSSENVGRKCYIRQYAVRYGVAYEEAEKILEEEECNFLSFKTRRGKKRRRSRSRGRRSRSFEKEEDHNRVYTKGFAPLPKQKYAKNFEETDFAEDVVCEEVFGGGKADTYGRINGGVEGERTREEGYYEEQAYPDSSYYEEGAGAPKASELARYPDEDYCSYNRDGPERRRRRRGGKKHRAKREEEVVTFAEPRRR